MAGMSDLSKEIMLMIIPHVSPDDLESFTSSCRGIYKLATEDLEKHRALKREHSVHRYDEILSKPHTALYVREIVLQRFRWTPILSPDPLLRPEDVHLPYSEETNSRVREEVSRLAPQNDVAKWLWYIKLGSETHIISLFLFLLPNLSTLRVLGVDRQYPYLYNTISRITTMKYPCAPLARLRHVQVSDSVHLYQIIADLPSLVSIEGVDLWARQLEPGPGGWMPRTRNVRELVLTRCSIHPRLFSDLLGSFKALRLFTYDLEYRLEKYQLDETAKFDPAWVCSALSFYFGSTLESLTLLSHHKGRRFMGDIHRFTNLRKLHTESQLLLSESDRYHNDASLAKSLPPKLEILELECSGEGDENLIAKSIVKLAELKPKHVPALEKVKVTTRNGVEDFNISKDDPTGAHHNNTSAAAEEDCHTYESVAAACEAQGFDLSVEVLDLAILELYERDFPPASDGGAVSLEVASARRRT